MIGTAAIPGMPRPATPRPVTPLTSNANAPMGADDQTAMGQVPTRPSHAIGPAGHIMTLPVIAMRSCALVPIDDDGGSVEPSPACECDPHAPAPTPSAKAIEHTAIRDFMMASFRAPC